ncbi:hypothetical protein SAMN05518672_103668 [Chitinophaga sp. CF118]|uniref:DUF6915 family protein n=1 Tax=Chitinophaga sp. CF118 TaxID=1884367 RepID=UPI0008E8D82D|nr:hypothetical protein [Chitinophaga sp. CF118]SFD88149.1 hypothetical protein SAMN05518672_103668 [Chitinophaga sp. CF118]
MNAYVHSQISVKRRGGVIDDYLPVHDFMDCTKELCSDNRHRILHTLWGIRRVVVPVFGQTILNSDHKLVNVKDLCEQDHILPDYRNRFIPTLADFARAIEPSTGDEELLKMFAKRYEADIELSELLLSPLSTTGNIRSLFFTHNSWFLNEIVPKVLKRKAEIRDFEIAPSDFFDRMNFQLWMDNGSSIPPSAVKTAGKIVG